MYLVLKKICLQFNVYIHIHTHMFYMCVIYLMYITYILLLNLKCFLCLNPICRYCVFLIHIPYQSQWLLVSIPINWSTIKSCKYHISIPSKFSMKYHEKHRFYFPTMVYPHYIKVSQNRGTPKSSVPSVLIHLNRIFHEINHPFRGYPHGKPPLS